MTLPNLPILADRGTVAVERRSGLIDVRGRTITGNAPAPDSDEWWAQRLVGALVERRAEIVPLWERYQGRAPFPELGNPVATRTRQRVWTAFQRKARMNLAELITSCVLERMTPIGARIDRDPDAPGAVATSAPAGGDTTGGSEGPGGAEDARERPADAPGPDARGSTPEGSDDAFNATARRIWRGNHMPVQSSDLIERMLVMREAYTITGPPDDEDPRLPVVTVEDPRYTITEPDPARPYRDIAGIKLYHDPINDVDVLVLHRPGRSVRFERESSLGTARASALDSPGFRFDPQDWRVTATADLRRWIGNRIAISRFTNRGGVGEFERHIDHLDRIDHMILQRIIVATLQAFKQRAVKGVPTKDPRTGEEIDYSDIFTADPGALWLLPATAELWESGTVDLTPLLSATRDDVRDLAAVLRMPVQHFMPDAANQSAEGAESGREGLVARANDRIVRCDDGFSDMYGLAFSYLPGDDGDDPLTITPLWKPVERFSLEARSSAAAQQNGITPWEDIMTDVLQYPPDDLPRLRAHRDADAALADAKAEKELARTTSAELEKGQQAADNAIEAARESAKAAAQNRSEPSGSGGGAGRAAGSGPGGSSSSSES